MTHESAYGLWSLVLKTSLVFIIFAFSFSKPQTQRDWRSFSVFSAFIVALFVEMYGFPLIWMVSHNAPPLFYGGIRAIIVPAAGVVSQKFAT